MMTKPKVTIVIVNWNVRDLLAACLYAGTSVGGITSIEGAGDLVARFGAEIMAAFASAQHERVTP